MDKKERSGSRDWERFRNSGSVDAYLAYKGVKIEGEFEHERD